jgi:hypothetical protein
LLPLVVSHYFKISPLIFTLCFLGVAGLMFVEHIRRTKLLNLGWAMTITWVLYRLVVLGLIMR